MKLSRTDALRLRLLVQGLTDDSAPPASVGEFVRSFVALQGQDFPAVQQAIGIRCRVSRDQVLQAFDRGEIVRGWPMRGTLFATTEPDLVALCSLTWERILRADTRRRADLGIDDSMLARARDVAIERLHQGPVSRSEILTLWKEAGLNLNDGRSYRFINHLSITGLMHWGPIVDNHQGLVLTRAVLSPEDNDPVVCLARLIHGYLQGHAPATVDDIAWWLKLPKGQIRVALGRLDTIASVEIEGEPTSHLILDQHIEALATAPELDPNRVLLLPSFDEYYLGYTNRTLVTGFSPDVVVASINGIFHPLIVVGGQVVGTWRRTRRKTGQPAEIDMLDSDLPKTTQTAIITALESWTDQTVPLT